jgi:tRNA A-37 threonylcarbamoyl transferase component Bud32/HEAT repeat protein
MEYCSQCKKLQPQGLKVCPDDGAEIILTKDLPSGVMLGVYRFERKLGQGGMGAVYEAEHTILKKRCAIKMLLPRFATQPEICARFLQEARATNAIKHDHIVQIYDFGQSPDGGAFLVMEFLYGETFDNYIKTRKTLSHEALVEIFYQLAQALEVAHQNNVIHRDLKPENIFILNNTQQKYFAKILDFGVAKIQGDLAVPGLTRVGTVVGTPQYISPEQLTGKAVSGRSDIYSLGVIFYHAATGELPFHGPRLSDYAKQHLFDAPKPPIALTPSLDEGLNALILRMMAKNPVERPASMEEVAQALEALRDGQTDPLLITPQPMTVERLPSASKTSWLAAVLVVVFFMCLGGGYAYFVSATAEAPTKDAFEAAAAGNFQPALALARQQQAAAFASSDAPRKREAISSLEATLAYQDLSPLIKALQDPDAEVNKRAITALGASQREEAKEALQQASHTVGKRLLPLVLFARLSLSPKDSTLLDLTLKELDNPTQRFEAAIALTKAGNPAGREELSLALDEPIKSQERALRAAETLFGVDKDERAKQFLLQKIGSQNEHTLLAAKLLSAQDVPEGYAVLVQASKTKEGFEAAVYRAQLLDKNVRPVLLKGLASLPQRKQAILALSLFRNPEDLSRLIPLLQDPEPSIQDAAAQAILVISANGEKK